MAIETIQLTDRLAVIVGNNQGRFPMSHSFLVQDEVCALIDTGSGLDLLPEIKETFRIDIIINSHGHPDHSAGNWLFPDTPVYAPRFGDGTHGLLEPLSRRFFPNETQAESWRNWIRKVMGFQDREPSEFFDDGHIFDFGRLKLQAIHTPGHTKDHFCFLEPNEGILLTFDIDLTPFGPWYGNTESSLTEFRAAIQKIRNLRPRIIASGHNAPIFEGIDESIDRYAGVMDHRTQVIMEMIRGGATRTDIIEAKPIYGYHPYARELLYLFEIKMIDLHIKEMFELGMIRIDGNNIEII